MNPTQEEIEKEFRKNAQELYTKENPLHVRAGTLQRIKEQRPDLSADVDRAVEDGLIIEDKN